MNITNTTTVLTAEKIHLESSQVFRLHFHCLSDFFNCKFTTCFSFANLAACLLYNCLGTTDFYCIESVSQGESNAADVSIVAL